MRERLLDALRRDTSAFAAALVATDPARPVAACPGWTVHDLGRHLAGVHAWATAALTSTAPPQEPTDPPPYAEAAAALVAALAATDPDTPCWGFGLPPRTAAFWLRRQVHETAVHLWDLDGTRPAAGQAVDGVGEVADVLVPRQVRLGRLPAPTAGLELVATDGPGRWTVPDAPVVAVVTAPAADLLLLLWRRVELAAVEVAGDPEAARGVLAGALVP